MWPACRVGNIGKWEPVREGGIASLLRRREPLKTFIVGQGERLCTQRASAATGDASKEQV